MNALMLDGWTPLFLLMIGMVVVMVLLARILARKTLYLTTAVVVLICIAMFFVSIFSVGGWDGMALGIIAILLLVGALLGTFIGRVIYKNVQV